MKSPQPTQIFFAAALLAVALVVHPKASLGEQQPQPKQDWLQLASLASALSDALQGTEIRINNLPASPAVITFKDSWIKLSAAIGGAAQTFDIPVYTKPGSGRFFLRDLRIKSMS